MTSEEVSEDPDQTDAASSTLSLPESESVLGGGRSSIAMLMAGVAEESGAGDVRRQRRA